LDESNTKLFPRFSVDQVKAALIDTPVVMVTGPRQTANERDFSRLAEFRTFQWQVTAL
jgi:hypothetical protein